MANALKQISARAKQLQRTHPNTQWKNLIKKASAEYRGKKKLPSKKKVSGIFSRKRKEWYDNPRGLSKRVNAGMTVSAAKHFLKKEYEELMGKAMVKRAMATTKKEKKYQSDHISILKKALKGLEKY